MKLLHLFFMLCFIVFVKNDREGIPVYHGDRRYWTIVADDDGHITIALQILKDQPDPKVKLLFPVDKTFNDIAAGIKLFSPSTNGKCTDEEKELELKLMINVENLILGKLKMATGSNREKRVKTFLYEQCGPVMPNNYYGSGVVEDTYLSIDSNFRECFKNPDAPFAINGGKKVMELQVLDGDFSCQVYMILPSYMKVDDPALPPISNPSPVAQNSSDPMIPTEITFDESGNVVINILNITKSTPYFFRIGTGQPIPSFKFDFGEKCNGAQFELLLNLKKECRVHIHLQDGGGFKISTKNAINENIAEKKLSSLIFGGSHVYVKVESSFIIRSFDFCDLLYQPASDQFVLEISPMQDSDECEKAQIILPKDDVKSGIQVLINHPPEIIVETTSVQSNDNNSTYAITTTAKTEKAGLEWWWFLAIGLPLLFIIGIAIFIYYYCIRPCLLKKKNKKSSTINLESLDFEEDERRTLEVKTAVSPELPKKEKEKKKVKEDEKILDKSNAAAAKEKDAKGEASSSKPTQKEPSSKPSQLEPTLKTQPQPPLPLVAAPLAPMKNVPRRKLKYRNMYCEDGFAKMDKPYDYHHGEGSKYEATVKPPTFEVPAALTLKNFWDMLSIILVQTGRFCKVYGMPGEESYKGHAKVYFNVRDLVKRDGEKYGGLRTALSNRYLEKFEQKVKLGDEPHKRSPYNVLDEDGKLVAKSIKTDWCFSLRVFITSYDPLTIEIHCKGPWPYFVFEIFECEKCKELLKALDENEWKKSPVTCSENWDTFVCRVKRTPINSHQFLTYYGDAQSVEPADPNDILNILVIRGNCEVKKLRECVRGCTFSDFSHPNGFELETPRAKPSAPTAAVQK